MKGIVALLESDGRLFYHCDLCKYKSVRRDTLKAHMHEHGNEPRMPISNMYLGPQTEDNSIIISNTVKAERVDSFSSKAENEGQRRKCEKCEHTVRFKGGTRDMNMHMTTVHFEVLFLYYFWSVKLLLLFLYESISGNKRRWSKDEFSKGEALV